MNFEENIASIRAKLETAGKMLDDGIVSCEKEEQSLWLLEPLKHDGQISVGIMEAKNMAIKSRHHVHQDCWEYIIVIEGEIMPYVKDIALKILKKGECFSVPPNTSHYTKPLTQNTKVICITIPGDSSLTEKYKRWIEGGTNGRDKQGRA